MAKRTPRKKTRSKTTKSPARKTGSSASTRRRLDQLADELRATGEERIAQVTDEARGSFEGIRAEADQLRLQIREDQRAVQSEIARAAELRGELEALEAKHGGRIEALVLEAIEQKDRLLHEFEQHRRTEAPVRYWAAQRDHYLSMFRVWWGTLLGVGVGVTALLITLWALFFGEAPLGQASVAAIGAVLLTAIVALLLIGVLSKIALSHLHLANEASERLVMLETYLALRDAGQIDDAQRGLILQALFRPGDDALLRLNGSASAARSAATTRPREFDAPIADG